MSAISAAFHESGHVIAAHAQGQPINCVFINAGGGGQFHHLPASTSRPVEPKKMFEAIRSARMPAQEAREFWRGWLITKSAGRLAQMRAGHGSDGCHIDLAEIHAIARAVCATAVEAEAYVAEIEAEAAELVAAHWSKIESVAAALLQRRHLDRDQISEAIADADLTPAQRHRRRWAELCESADRFTRAFGELVPLNTY